MIRNELLNVSFYGASGQIQFKSNGDIDSQAFAQRTMVDGQPMDVQ